MVALLPDETGSAPRVQVVVGTRPEAIKLFPVIHALKADGRCVVSVCCSGQHREMAGQVLTLAGIVPDHVVDCDFSGRNSPGAGQGLDRLVAALTTGLGQVMDQVRPCRVLVQGDTATAMAGALAAYHRKIPVAHIEAGLRSHDIYRPWPEEANRRIIATMAAVHFAPTSQAVQALADEGIDPTAIHLTGNTGIDALHWVCARVQQNPDLAAGLDPVFSRFSERRIIAVTVHRRESHGAALASITKALAAIAERPDVALVVPLHPNPAVRDVLVPALGHLANVALLEPLDYPHFARLLLKSDLVLTDSGGVQEEAPALGVPVLVLRDTTERGEGIAAGTARLVGTEAARIVAEAVQVLNDPACLARMGRQHSPFGDGKAAVRIAQALAGSLTGAAGTLPGGGARGEYGRYPPHRQ